MPVDPVNALESLGYTHREASFLYLVAVHSGYFVRRQFDYFVDRNRGGLVSRFLEKTRINGHVQLLDTAHGRQVYHLFYKPIYRLIGAPDSQNRRVKGDADVRARLMKLDYVLENDGEHHFASDEEKLQFFSETRGIDARTFTSADGAFLPELRSMPISIVDRTHPAHSLVRFAFIDEGLLTTTKFQRVLEAMTELLNAVAHFELIYVATSDHNFQESSAIFWKEFSTDTQPKQGHLHPDWRNVPAGRPTPSSSLRSQFTTLLLRFHYPSLTRNELRCSVPCSGVSMDEKR